MALLWERGKEEYVDGFCCCAVHAHPGQGAVQLAQGAHRDRRRGDFYFSHALLRVYDTLGFCQVTVLSAWGDSDQLYRSGLELLVDLLHGFIPRLLQALHLSACMLEFASFMSIAGA